MIRVLEGMPAGVLGFEAGGTLTADDYREVLEPALEAARTSGSGKIRILLAFTEEFSGMQPGAMWQDLKTGVREWSSWERIALVSDQRWMRESLQLFAWAVPGEVRAFETADRDAALAWVAAD